MDDTRAQDRLTTRDRLILAGFCLLFFGLSLVGGRPLTMHEGVLPETSREMAARGDWIIPTNGGRPWIENPPLPQWITVGIGALLGGCDRVWVVRIGPALAATLCVLLVAGMSARWFGRSIGLLSGFVLATTYEFTQYAWLAEDEIFLCALCTLAVDAFVRLEFPRDTPRPVAAARGFFSSRSRDVVWLFVALGLTNLAKGILFGAVMVGAPMVVWLAWNRDRSRLRTYAWFWGGALFAALLAAWPLAAMWKMPDVLDVWKYDHIGRLDGSYDDLTEPWFYYLKVLPTNLAPWTIVVPIALYLTRQAALHVRHSPERFLWCWAIVPIVVFSIPTGKHHHYLLHCMAPWAVLVARTLPGLHQRILAWPERMRNPINSLATLVIPGEIAIFVLRQRLPGPMWLPATLMVAWPLLAFGFSWATAQTNARTAASGLMAAVTIAFAAGHVYAGAYMDQCIDDTAFLRAIPSQVPGGDPVYVNADMKSLDECRIQFYLGNRSRALHNLTFLADEQMPRFLYLVARAGHEKEIARYGTVDVITQSQRTRRERSPEDRLTLFHVTLDDGLPRYSSAGIRVSPLQAMGRASGPFLGDPLASRPDRQSETR